MPTPELTSYCQSNHCDKMTDGNRRLPGPGATGLQNRPLEWRLAPGSTSRIHKLCGHQEARATSSPPGPSVSHGSGGA